jgi:hypothetical protein
VKTKPNLEESTKRGYDSKSVVVVVVVVVVLVVPQCGSGL